MDQFDDAPDDVTAESMNAGKRRRCSESRLDQNGTAASDNGNSNSDDETEPVNDCEDQQQAPSKRSRVAKKLKKKAAQKYASLMTCLQHAMFTGSLYVESSSSGENETQNKILPSVAVAALSSLQVITCSYLPRTADEPANKNTNTIYIQPLLILDLNGILCHRLRPNREPSGILRYRPAAHHIAGTPVIPRNDLESFLMFLDQHFCLAVFTSAKPKNARKLVEALFPETVAQSLLFVWGQNRCRAKNAAGENGDGDSDATTIFEKNLDLVWSEYPLWNEHNTLLIDDSPEKCLHWRRNAVHPPSLHGQVEREPAATWLKPDGQGMEPSSSSTTSPEEDSWMLDVDNERQQMEFFSKLVEYWKSNSYKSTWNEHGEIQPNVQSEQAYWHFLKAHASGHMGWGE